MKRLTGEGDSCNLLIGPAAPHVAVRAWEPHLTEVSSIVASLPPHGAVEGGAPFVEGQGMEGVINAERDIETLEAYLCTSNLST